MELSESASGIDAPIEAVHVDSADGTRIAAFRIGRGPVTWVSPPAMGAPLLSMKRVFEPLADRCTILTWDMRGFFASDAPRDPEAYRVADHLADMEAVVGAFGAREFVLGGWSMGVQLSLEAVHRDPDRVRALVLLAGPYRHALETAVPVAHPLVVRGLRRAYDVGPGLTGFARRALAPAWLPRALVRSGLVAGEPELFGRVVERFRENDWGRYLTVARHLHEHDAEPYLARIDKPTFVACGTRDLFTPLAVAERLAGAIAGAELLVIPKASHYLVVEHGALLAERIAEFLDRVQ